MNDKHFESWEKLRVKGRTHFMLVKGLLMWGVPMFVIMTFIINQPESGSHSVTIIAINALIWSIGGVFFGWLTWSVSEKRYQKALKARQNL